MTVKDLYKIIQGNNLIQSNLILNTDDSFGEYSGFTKKVRPYEVMKTTFKDCVITKIENISKDNIEIKISSLKEYESNEMIFSDFVELLQNVEGEHYLERPFTINGKTLYYGNFEMFNNSTISNISIVYNFWNGNKVKANLGLKVIEEINEKKYDNIKYFFSFFYNIWYNKFITLKCWNILFFRKWRNLPIIAVRLRLWKILLNRSRKRKKTRRR